MSSTLTQARRLPSQLRRPDRVVDSDDECAIAYGQWLGVRGHAITDHVGPAAEDRCQRLSARRPEVTEKVVEGIADPPRLTLGSL